MSDIKFLATQERIERHVTVDEYIGMTEGDIKTMLSVMSKFVLASDGISFMEPKEARKLLGALTITELKAAFLRFNGVQEDAIVNPKPEA